MGIDMTMLMKTVSATSFHAVSITVSNLLEPSSWPMMTATAAPMEKNAQLKMFANVTAMLQAAMTCMPRSE